MNLAEIDPNMSIENYIPEGTAWFDATDAKHVSLFGVHYDTAAERYLRMPPDKAAAVSDNVARLNRHTSGGRIAFVTDSDTVSLYAKIIPEHFMSMMSWSGQASFDLYINGKFCGLFRNKPKMDATCTYTLPGRNLVPLPKGKKHVVIHFPCYAEISRVLVGVSGDSMIAPDNPYKDLPPVLYYGSSITQGAAVSRPGLMYQNYLAREFGYDYFNLGFSGNAKGEAAMIEYLFSLPSSLFVMDFDHNLNAADKLVQAHYPLYKAYRTAHPDTPILFISRPSFDFCPCSVGTRDVIIDTLERARAEGDQNVYFLDGETIYGEQHRDACTVDGTHPNDVGFFRFYEALRPYFANILK